MNQEHKIFHIANYIIEVCQNKKIKITNLKLQKIMFYCYAHFLVKHNGNETLFNETLEAWPYGPVFPKLYVELRNYRYDPIKTISGYDKIPLTDDEKESIDYVIQKYGKLAAWELAEKTHKEDPWLDAYHEENFFDRNQITDCSIFEYYSIRKI